MWEMGPMRGMVHRRSVWLAPLALLILTFCIVLAYPATEETGTRTEDDQVYQYHIALITNDQDALYWDEVYDGAREAAASFGALIERTGEDLLEETTVSERLAIAEYSHVDGVLVYPEDTEDVRQDIDRLVAAGIPVITLHRDAADSDRQGFVGVNDYFLGQQYGQEIQAMEAARKRYITILYPESTFGEDSRKWFEMGFRSVAGTEDCVLTVRLVEEDGELSTADEIVNELLVGEGDTIHTDVLLCLDSTTTEIAWRILTDWGVTDRVHLVGGSVSETIYEGIRDGGIDFTITADAADLGTKAVRELRRYLDHDVVNYSSSVDFLVINQDNLDVYTEVDDGSNS